MLYQWLKKWYLMLPCLTLCIMRYGSSVKWSNPGKGVESYPTPQCSSNWKGSLYVTFDYVNITYILFIESPLNFTFFMILFFFFVWFSCWFLFLCIRLQLMEKLPKVLLPSAFNHIDRLSSGFGLVLWHINHWWFI